MLNELILVRLIVPFYNFPFLLLLLLPTANYCGSDSHKFAFLVVSAIDSAQGRNLKNLGRFLIDGFFAKFIKTV